MASLSPLHPEFDGEVAVEEYGIFRMSCYTEGDELQCHIVLDRLVVQLGGDDDVLIRDIAGHDVLVELHNDVIAIAQDAVCGCRSGEVAWPHVVLHHGYLAAVHADVLGAIHRGGVGTEGVVALWVEVVIFHVEAQEQVARGGQHLVVKLGGVGAVDEEIQRVGPRPGGGTLVAVFHAQFLHTLELTVETSDFQLQVALVAVQRLDVEHRVSDGEVDGR